MVYTDIKYNELTDQEHLKMLRKLLGNALTIMPGDNFKMLLLGQDNSYLLQFLEAQQKQYNGKI